jgi:hypothetical protein
MVIDQRNAGASVSATVLATLTYLVDRWGYYVTQASKMTAQQNSGAVTPPPGYSNYLGVVSSSAYAVLAADIFVVEQRIEGFNTTDLAWGTASAKAVSLSFWVRSSLTGTFGGAVNSAAGSYSYPFTYSIAAANTWTQISVTIPGATAGTWGTGNNAGIQVSFGLGVGTTSSGTAGAWAAANYASATGAVSVVGTSAATWYVTGVQLELGSTATTFEQRSYGLELALCQRYYEILSTFAASNSGANRTDTTNIKYQVTKRTTPTVAIFGTPTVNTGTNTIAGTQLDNTYINGAGVYVGNLSILSEL